ncbi:16S rRNA (guanine(966)-N(2))-methyltransferase RsmD [Neptunomonas japonica]|uniref:Ribosomal RNA small subunit methyltransferase D n=1 Tax=Neptunomonas japonica JAMM 1380 TaxID=1441457 RepID=A0A7R6PDQ3_9GAMM|nr:16S rRNA (guanine(966)-N(2))-methyltransferase RsmD [Neptunomonas japonica]BBB28162.1 16S rRNA (guanine966-N2)-methyltransferase [Neptunomonas japonica JAMM 1380]
MPRRNPPRKNSSNQEPRQMLRIIGGEWRSRKVPFPSVENLRPTPDRVRETLFNWLQNITPGARCLDLFAGSGALGLEALSRGASSVTFIDNSPAATYQLKDNLQTLKCQNGEVITSSAINWLEARQTDTEPRYDLVFLDPPFRKDMVPVICELLEKRNLLSDHAVIYIEAESELSQLLVPDSWKENRSKTAGQVTYRLFYKEPS